MAKSFFMACSPFVASLFFRLSRIFTASEKVIPLYKNQLSACYFSTNAQNKQDGSCLFAPICNAFGKSDLFCLLQKQNQPSPQAWLV
jgi:hypothetical protein